MTPRSLSPSFLPLALLLLLAACESYGRVEGTVMSASSTPVPDASVTFHCDASGRTEYGKTDTAGKFKLGAIAMSGKSCTVAIEKPGFVKKVVPAEDVCHVDSMDAKCASVPTVTLAIEPVKK